MNPATREVEISVLQAAFHLATRSLFTYFGEPGSVQAHTAEDNRLRPVLEKHQSEDYAFADKLAVLVRERGLEPTARAFPEKFTRLNFLTYSSATSYLRDDLATQKETLERLLEILPENATPTVREALEQFREERDEHLGFWTAEAKKAAEATAARVAARKAKMPPAKK